MDILHKYAERDRLWTEHIAQTQLNSVSSNTHNTMYSASDIVAPPAMRCTVPGQIEYTSEREHMLSTIAKLTEQLDAARREAADARAKHCVFVTNCKKLIEYGAQPTPVMFDMIIPLLDEYGFENWTATDKGLRAYIKPNESVMLKLTPTGYSIKAQVTALSGGYYRPRTVTTETLDGLRAIITKTLAIIPLISATTARAEAARAAMIKVVNEHAALVTELRVIYDVPT